MIDPLPQAAELAALRGLAPSDYFQGARTRSLCLADNVVVFLRRDRDALNQRSFESRPHHRHVLILNLMTAGSASVDGSVFRLRPGEAFLVAPFQFHFYIEVERQEIAWLFITFETPDPAPFAALANIPLPLDAALADRAVEIARLFGARERASQTQLNRIALSSSTLLNELRGLARAPSAELPQAAANAAGYGLAQRINRLLHDRLAEGIGIAELAARLKVSESYLRKRFKAITGLSLGRYLLHYKLNRAVKLLAHSRSTLTQIAVDCGYESLAAFSRSFKDKLGVSPSLYRKNGFGAR